MIDILLDNTNDLLVQNGDLAFISGSNQIGQAVKQSLGTFFGEWFLNNSLGVPYFQQILVPTPNLDLVQALLLNAIQTVPGVVQIKSFNYDYNNSNRALQVTVSILTSNGQTLQVSNTAGV